jgi:AcrR family transcriptional regulator
LAVERLGRNDYFEAGLQLLAEGGAKIVTIGNLCHRLGVTKGSFYHHFESGPEFMRALLLYWESAYGRQLAEAALAVEDPLARIDVLKRLAADLNHDAESAGRCATPGWAAPRHGGWPASAWDCSSDCSRCSVPSTVAGCVRDSTSTSGGWRRSWWCRSARRARS